MSHFNRITAVLLFPPERRLKGNFVFLAVSGRQLCKSIGKDSKVPGLSAHHKYQFRTSSSWFCTRCRIWRYSGSEYSRITSENAARHCFGSRNCSISSSRSVGIGVRGILLYLYNGSSPLPSKLIIFSRFYKQRFKKAVIGAIYMSRFRILVLHLPYGNNCESVGV